MTNDLKQALKGMDPADSVIVGIGNMLKRDDGAGPALAQRLLRSGKVPVIDAGNAPENYIGKIASLNKKNIIFLDALDFSAQPGGYKLFNIDDVYDGNIASHTFSIGFIFDLIRSEIDCTGYVLGIQPFDLRFGSGLTEAVADALDEATVIFEEWITRI